MKAIGIGLGKLLCLLSTIVATVLAGKKAADCAIYASFNIGRLAGWMTFNVAI